MSQAGLPDRPRHRPYYCVNVETIEVASNRFMSRNLFAYKNRLDDYFNIRKAEGLGVPESARTGGKPSFCHISNATGIRSTTLQGSSELRQHVFTWASRIGYSPAERKVRGSGLERKRKYLETIEKYLSRLKREKMRLPENPRRNGSADWEFIAGETGIPVNAFRPDTALGKRMAEAVAELGLEVYRHPWTGHEVTFGELLEWGGNQREQELSGRKNARQQLYKTRSKLRFFMARAGKLSKGSKYREDDPVGAEMLEQFENRVRAITGSIKSKSTRRTFSREIRRWQAYFIRLVAEKELSLKFAAALEEALGRSSLSVKQLAAAAAVSEGKLYAWLRGSNAPAVESFPDIRRVEEVLSLERDTLTSKVIRSQTRSFSPQVYPEFITVDGERIHVRKNRSILGNLRPLLPDDYDQHTEDEREEMVTWLVKNLIRPTGDWGRWHRTMLGVQYALKKLPPTVEKEFRECVNFRRGKLPPLGMDRAAQWGYDSEVLHQGVLRKLFGFMSAPADAEDGRLRGLDLDPQLFTMAMLLRPEFVETWLRWNAKRRKGGDQVESYSFYDLYVLEWVVCELRPKTGWLRQRPDLANHIRPVPGYVDAAFIKRAKKNWNRVCDEALESYLTLTAQVEEVAEEQRDPFEPILPLLDLEHPQHYDPITALKIFSRNIINDLVDHSVAPLKAARQVRNYLVTRVLSATALRSRNLRELTYRDDNKGQLRRRGGKWYILLPWHRFKNKHSSFFGPKRKKQDYEKALADKDGLYDWLEEYIKVHRPVLLAGRESEVFFVATGEQPMFTAGSFSTMYRRLTMNYFAFNPYLGRGIPGVRPHGPHAVRDMMATFVLQTTGSYELAAYAICDTAETVKNHYGRFGPKDKTRLVDSIVNAAWDANTDGNLPDLTLPLRFPPSDTPA